MAERVSGVSDLVHPRTQVGKSPLTQWLSWLGRLLSEELAPSPRRIKTSLRKTTIATIAAGLMAACHVTNPLGPYVVWVMLGSSLMMSPARAVGYLIITGIVLAAADPLAGILAESPWLMLPFIGIFTAIITYESTIRKLGPIGLVWEVVTLDTLYGVVFDPRNFGWSDSALFGGCALGFAMIAAFDTWIWPNPAEAILLESLAASLEGMRMRFVKASAYYLDETNAERPQEPLQRRKCQVS